MTIHMYLRFLIATTLVYYHTVQGQCPFTVANSAIRSCDGSSNAGAPVYIDFHKINSPCTCTVIPAISGDLYIRSEEVTLSTCTTTIIVGNTLIYTCPTADRLVSLNVIENQPVTVIAGYQPNYNSGTFHHCFGLHQLSADVKITCGSGSVTQTTTQQKTTTTAEKTTVYVTSTQISSTGIEMSVTLAHKDNTTTVSCPEPVGNKPTQMDEVSNMHLQIPLALFVGAAVVSVILNIYLFIKLRQRNDSKSQRGQNTSQEVNQSFTNQSAADAYTELDMANMATGTMGEGNQAYTELDLATNTRGTTGERNQAYTELNITNNASGTTRNENQYDSLLHVPPRDYINLNTA